MSAPLDLGPRCRSCFARDGKVIFHGGECKYGRVHEEPCREKLSGCRGKTWRIDGYCSNECKFAAAARRRREGVAVSAFTAAPSPREERVWLSTADAARASVGSSDPTSEPSPLVPLAVGSALVGRPDRSGRARDQAETSGSSDAPTADPTAAPQLSVGAR